MTFSSRGSGAALSIALAAVLFFAITIISDFVLRGARIDLTATRQFTLSQGTINILRALDEPVTLRFFFSEKMASRFPQIRVYGTQVRDLLLEYQSHARGKLILEIVDPEPFSQDEDRAVALGVSAIPTDTGDNLYFGLVGTNAVDGREAIAFFSQDRESFLEYDLTNLVYRLTLTKKPLLGLLSRLPLEFGLGGPMAAMQGQGQPFVIYEQLTSVFEVENISQDADHIPDDVDVLMVVHPTDLPEKTLYALDQFVLSGGRMIVFLDPLLELNEVLGVPSQGISGPGRASDLEPLLKSWGVAYDSSIVVADLSRALRVQAAPQSGRPYSDYVVWLGLVNNDVAKDDLVTSAISMLNVAGAGAFFPLQGAKTQFTSLVRTTANSMTLEADEIATTFNPDDLVVSFQATPESYTIATRISGDVMTAFPDGPPPLEIDETETPESQDETPPPPSDTALAEENQKSDGAIVNEHLATSTVPANLILVADADMFDDRFWVQQQNILGQRITVPTADNGTFVMNAVENLMGSNDLISLRSRARDDRPLTAIDELRRQADAQFLAQQEQLEQELSDTEARLAALQSAAGTSDAGPRGVMLTPEESQEIARFQAQLLDTRAQLRAVQHNLRGDIERLETRVRFINIAMMPILVALFAVALAWIRRRRAAGRASAPISPTRSGT